MLPASHYKRKVKKNLHADRRGRFRTQPITCMEIKVRDGGGEGGGFRKLKDQYRVIRNDALEHVRKHRL